MPRAAISRRSHLSRPAICLRFFVAAYWLAAAGIAVADEPSTSSDEITAKARVLIKNMLKEREKITSGVVFVRGTQIIRGDELPERPTRGMYAFDHEHGLLRFDNTKHTIVRSLTRDKLRAAGDNINVASALVEPDICDTLLRYVRNADYSASWFKQGRIAKNAMSLRRVDAEMGAALASMHHMIDLRACGVMTYRELDSGDFDRGITVKDYCEALLKLPVAEVIEKDGLAVVVFRREHRELHLTIDTARQFSPVDFVFKWFKSPGTTFDCTQSSHTKWGTVNGFRVPKSYSIELDIPEPNEYVICRFSYDWQSVNKPVGTDYFDYKCLPDIPDGTNVMERRKGKAFPIGVWKAGRVVGPEDDPDEELPDAEEAAIESPAGTREQVPIKGARAGQERDDNCLRMKFVWCPPGRFVMGSPPGESEPLKTEVQAEVVLTRGFWLGKYEVTQAQWTKLKTPDLWKGERLIKEGEDFPATYLSWANAMAFCEKLTKLERAAGRLADAWQYTLPTEAQWEYTCRAGTTTRFSFGDDEALLNDYAWNRNNTIRADEAYAHVVGQKKPNPFGLHDMHGNVAEWCRDGWKEKVPGGTDPLVPANDDLRVIRGGHWWFPAVLCRSAFRDSHRALSRNFLGGELGFRVALCRVK